MSGNLKLIKENFRMLLKSHIGKLLFAGVSTVIWFVSLVGLILLVENRSSVDADVYGIILSVVGMLLVLIPFAAMNWFVRKKIYKQKEPFEIFSGIRNVESMYIGEISIGGGYSSAVSIYTPGATDTSVYEVLKHTFSILNEKGSTVILCVNCNQIDRKCKPEKEYTIFDLPFYNGVSVKRLRLKKLVLISYFPLIFRFSCSVRFLFKIGEGKPREVPCTDKKLLEFCTIRNIKLKYLVV